MSSSSGDPVDDFTNRDSDSLLGMVDFIGIVKRLVNSGWIAGLSIVTGVILSVKRAYEEVVGAIATGITTIYTALVPSGLFAGASAEASGEISAFGLFALPVAVAVALTTMGGVALVLYLFTGVND